MELRELLPGTGTIDVQALLDTLELARRAPEDRPYTVVNFIVSADGRATIGGRSRGLGDDGDRAMFHGLREQFDAVLAGTGTLATEHYGRILGKAERRARRTERGLPAEPLACVFTRSGHVPTNVPLFAEPEARVVIFTNTRPSLPSETRPSLPSAKAKIEVVELDPGELTLTTALRRLRRDFGIATLLCEGGPTLFGGMLQESLVDELFLTVAPRLAGGGRGPTISAGPELAQPRKLELVWLLERHGALYQRYSLC